MSAIPPAAAARDRFTCARGGRAGKVTEFFAPRKRLTILRGAYVHDKIYAVGLCPCLPGVCIYARARGLCYTFTLGAMLGRS